MIDPATYWADDYEIQPFLTKKRTLVTYTVERLRSGCLLFQIELEGRERGPREDPDGHLRQPRFERIMREAILGCKSDSPEGGVNLRY